MKKKDYQEQKLAFKQELIKHLDTPGTALGTLVADLGPPGALSKSLSK